MTDSKPYVLEIKNLQKRFDRDLFKKSQIILNSLSCGFPEGQCTALMGHNGAGKTTTIRTIFGLIRPDAGEVLFRGKPLTLEDKKLIGYMPETNKLPTNLTCEEILSHQLRVFSPRTIERRHYREAIEGKLREIGLWEHRKKKVGKLSKGMGRRLSWAQATIHKPELIILDEPMSGLDPLGHRLMADLINQMRQEKVSIILCTHELWSINELCDQVHILNHGRLSYSTLHSQSSASPLSSSLYHRLTITGCQPQQLENLKENSRLPAWQNLTTHAMRLELGFQDYGDAVKWLQASILKGLVVIDFKKSSQLDEDNLIRHFGEERSA